MHVRRKSDKKHRRGADPVAGRRIAALFDAHARMVVTVCHRHLRDAEDAEDAAQQTFLSAYRSLLGGADPENGAAWLTTIARNECRTRIARRLGGAATVPLPENPPYATIADVETHAERRAEIDALTRALSELPERQRQAVVLRDLYGLSYGEVAAAMRVSEPAVESLLSRGRRTVENRVARVRAVPGALVVPGSLRDEIARLVPGFPAAEGAGAAAGGGATALLAKLASVPVAGKAAAAATVATVAVAIPVGVESLRDGNLRTNGADAAAAAMANGTEPSESFAPAERDRLTWPSLRTSSSAGKPGSRGGPSSGSSRARSRNSGPGSTDSGSGSLNSGPGSTSSGSPSVDSRSRSTNSGSGSMSSESGSTDSGSASSGSSSGSRNSGPGSNSSGSNPTSSESGSESASGTSRRESSDSGSRSASSSSGSTNSGSDSTSSGSGSGD